MDNEKTGLYTHADAHSMYMNHQRPEPTSAKLAQECINRPRGRNTPRGRLKQYVLSAATKGNSASTRRS